jgi:hypothetical protein
MNTPDVPATEGSPESNRGKPRAALFSLFLIGAVLWPIQQNWRDDPRDDFPLSYYPMFSFKRDPIETFYYVVGRDQQGARHYIRHKLIGDGGGNQVRRQLRRIIKEDRAAELAQTVAKRLAREEKAPWCNIVSIDVCRGKFAVDDFFHGHKEPVREQVKASCEVRRKSS